MTLISAIVSTCASSHFSSGCLDNLLDQSLYKKGELEIVVVASRAQQGDKDLVRAYQGSYGKIVLVESECEAIYGALNQGIRVCKGRFVTNVKEYDHFHPEAMEILANALQNDPEVDLVYSHSKVSRVNSASFWEVPSEEVYIYPPFYPPQYLLLSGYCPFSMWRRTLHDKIGWFDDSLLSASNWDFNIRMALERTAKLVPQVLSTFYLASDNITNPEEVHQDEKVRVLNKWRTRCVTLQLLARAGYRTEEASERAQALNAMAVRALSFFQPKSRIRGSDPEFALSCLAWALEEEPDNKLTLRNLLLFREAQRAGRNLQEISNRMRDSSTGKLLIPPPSATGMALPDPVRYYCGKAKRSNAKVVNFFAGHSDQFNFAIPIMEHLERHGLDVRMICKKDVETKGLEALLGHSDLAWFEWGQGYVVEASWLPKICPMVCRIHRFEVYTPRMAQVNWQNIDATVFVNQRFINVFHDLTGKNLSDETRVHVIPNPLTFSDVFHDRKPGHQIAHVSRFHADKNPALALQVLAALVKRDDRYTLSMVGGIQDMQLFYYCQDFVRKSGLAQHFIYEGPCADVENWLLDKTYLLSTSVVESQGLAVLEAMCQGIKPVIHKGFAMEETFPKEYFFDTVDEAVSLIMERKYDSKTYQRQALERFQAEKVLTMVSELVHEEL